MAQEQVPVMITAAAGNEAEWELIQAKEDQPKSDFVASKLRCDSSDSDSKSGSDLNSVRNFNSLRLLNRRRLYHFENNRFSKTFSFLIVVYCISSMQRKSIDLLFRRPRML